jgi:hypothetical protein
MQIDFSATDTYIKCGKRYEFRYVHGIKSPPSVAMAEGSAHHKAMEINNVHKIEKSRDLKASQMTEVFVDDFRKRVDSEELEWGDEDENKIYSRAKAIHVVYARDVAPLLRPVASEKKFEKEVTLNGRKFTIYGTVDLEDAEPAILDYKTVARARSQSDVDNTIQLSLYAFASKVPTVGIINLVKKANPEVGIVKSRRTPSQILWALNIAQSVAESVQKGAFHYTDPGNWWCSSRFCGYWNMCRGKY